MTDPHTTAEENAPAFIEWARAERHADSEWTLTRREARLALAAELASVRADLEAAREALRAAENVIAQELDPQVEEAHAQHGMWRLGKWVRVYEEDCALCEYDQAVALAASGQTGETE